MAVRVFVNGLEPWLEGLREDLEAKLRDLGVPPATLPLVTEDEELPERSLAVYFSDGAHVLSGDDLGALLRLRDAGVVILPAVDSMDVEPEKRVPEGLGNINALCLGDPPAFDRLTAEILDRLWHFRRRRKLFLSYKRSDSAAVARQLQKELTNRGYEVFLDESSIAPGEDFQRRLLSWMNDADCVLLLASPNLESSQWVVEEIEFANHAAIGVLAICWPKQWSQTPEIVRALMEDQIHRLEVDDLKPGSVGRPDEDELEALAVERILDRIESYRPRAIQHRLEALIKLLRDGVEESGYRLEAGDRFGDFVVSKDDEPEASPIRVLPFRPTLASLADLHRDLERGGQSRKAAACFYAENDRTDPDAASLGWALAADRPPHELGARRYRLVTSDDLSGGPGFDFGSLL